MPSKAAAGAQPLYQSYRQPKAESTSLGYELRVSNGRCRVSLHFGDFDPTEMGTGARVFDVAIQEKRVLTNLNVFEEVGAYQALVKTRTVDVTDRRLLIRLDHVVGEPRIAAIRIRGNENPSDLDGLPADDHGSVGNPGSDDAGGGGTPNDAANPEYGSHNSSDALVTKSAAAGHRWIVSNAEQTTLQANAGAFARRRKRDVWCYNPRTGGSLQRGSVATVSGPGEVSLGSPPSEAREDWAILITRQGKP